MDIDASRLEKGLVTATGSMYAGRRAQPCDGVLQRRRYARSCSSHRAHAREGHPPRTSPPATSPPERERSRKLKRTQVAFILVSSPGPSSPELLLRRRVEPEAARGFMVYSPKCRMAETLYRILASPLLSWEYGNPMVLWQVLPRPSHGITVAVVTATKGKFCR